MSKTWKKIPESTMRKIRKLAHIYNTQDMESLMIQVFSWGFYPVDEWDFRLVNQPHWILYWNPTPGLKLEVGRKIVEPNPDRIYLFAPHTRFSGNEVKPFIQFYLHFSVGEPFNRVRNRLFTFPAENFPEMMLEAAHHRGRLTRSLYLQQIALAALAKVPLNAFAPDKRMPLDQRICLVLDQIDRDPAKAGSVEELSASVRMSPNNFHRKFADATNTTPKQYILRRRLEHARYLLMHSSLNIDEIASESGFQNRYHFSKTFKNYYVFPPVAYRKMMERTHSTSKPCKTASRD